MYWAGNDMTGEDSGWRCLGKNCRVFFPSKTDNKEIQADTRNQRACPGFYVDDF